MDARHETPPDPAAGEPGRSPGFDAAAMAAQLQAMIDQVARVSAPALRVVAVKAAELAVAAGEHAGPIARGIADRTDEAGRALAREAAAFAAAHRAAPPDPEDPPPP